MANILILHGPNLNLLGKREPETYGNKTLDDINKQLHTLAKQHNVKINCFQSNSESELIERIHSASDEQIDYIIFNPAAYTHTSVALRDALLAVGIPFTEIHMSNINAREAFREESYFADIAQGVITGFGTLSYELALIAAIKFLG